MIITIDWNQYLGKGYLSKGPNYISEDEDRWEIYTYDGPLIIKAIIEKRERIEENIMFIERYFQGRASVTKAIDVETSTAELKNLNMLFSEPNPALAVVPRKLDPNTGEPEEEIVIPSEESMEAQADLTRERANYNEYTHDKGEAEDYIEQPRFKDEEKDYVEGYIDNIPKFNPLNNKETDNEERYTSREEE